MKKKALSLKESVPGKESGSLNNLSRSTGFLVIGSGIAGLFSALTLSKYGEVLLVTKGGLNDSSSYFAQGGVAAAIEPPDSPELHRQDTLFAGAGLCNPRAVEVLVQEGPGVIQELMEMGMRFDRANGHLALSREGAHSQRRVLHADGDSTGRAISEHLAGLVRSEGNITILENHFALELRVSGGACAGARVLSSGDGIPCTVSAAATVLATGGAGQLYSETSNPALATGDGIALAYRVGGEVMDLEFIQFHPTVLVAGRPRFLISEAVRGEGAVLRNPRGRRFMVDHHPLADLAPRDVVARAIAAEMTKEGGDHVFLDATHLDTSEFRLRFPTIYATCLERGLDPSKDLLPVAPAAHYMMGGVRTGLDAETNLPGLFACGEAACTGVHGANRLASNSLLETVVFGKRAAVAAARYSRRGACAVQARGGGGTGLNEGAGLDARTGPREDGRHGAAKAPAGARHAYGGSKAEAYARLEGIRRQLQLLMGECVGIVRSGESIERGLERLAHLRDLMPASSLPQEHELENMLETALLIMKAALVREESRGAHYRSDFPDTRRDWEKHTIQRRGAEPYFRT